MDSATHSLPLSTGPLRLHGCMLFFLDCLATMKRVLAVLVSACVSANVVMLAFVPVSVPVCRVDHLSRFVSHLRASVLADVCQPQEDVQNRLQRLEESLARPDAPNDPLTVSSPDEVPSLLGEALARCDPSRRFVTHDLGTDIASDFVGPDGPLKVGDNGMQPATEVEPGPLRRRRFTRPALDPE